ncbi:hypothetical protein GDO78_004635 [Eleutherodactylus coqui]|uniref:Uncharacterized protein n=1 Tax=Eleutherodactylus coqui TaxID=57060 RepID=A0A8J6ERV9_ELECQ|nr:hypothetical protein GDO78_004635 [Eleutherodactylus coqui]
MTSACAGLYIHESSEVAMITECRSLPHYGLPSLPTASPSQLSPAPLCTQWVITDSVSPASCSVVYIFFLSFFFFTFYVIFFYLLCGHGQSSALNG